MFWIERFRECKVIGMTGGLVDQTVAAQCPTYGLMSGCLTRTQVKVRHARLIESSALAPRAVDQLRLGPLELFVHHARLRGQH